MSLGEKIKALREARKISREELAKKLDISYWALSKYETNEREPDYKTLVLIADFFKVSTDYLLGRINEPELNIDNVLSGFSDEEKKEIFDFVTFMRKKHQK